jgi:DNA-directed RNA polymerase specialized sigma24 family protein
VKAVVRNQAIDFVKERGRWAPPGSPSETLAEQSVGALAARDRFDVSAGIADEQCVEFLRQEVTRLRREEQELFLMKARGLKEREIVALTGRPAGTVSSQIARLLERLRLALKDRGCL